MKAKLFPAIAATLLFCNVQAQIDTTITEASSINDTDAKLLYQQAEDAYNNTDYLTAAGMTYDLAVKMGTWKPKILYLNLKSVYLNYTAANGQTSNGQYAKRYDNFKLFFERCTTFFSLIDKATYPPEKYKEIAAIQTYFKGKVDEYTATKDRTPQDAIDFLNECAKRFPIDKKVPAYQNDEGIEPIWQSLSFELKDSILIIKQLKKEKHDRTVFSYATIYMTDLSQITGILSKDFNGNICNDCGYCYLTGTETSWFNNSGNKQYGLKGCVVSYSYGDTSASVGFAFQNWKHTSLQILATPNKYWNGGLFDQTSANFQDGDYANRIKDAFQFLIDYFPKKKEETNETKSKF